MRQDTNLDPKGFLDRLVSFFLKNKLIVLLLVLGTVLWGLMVAPFDWRLGGIPRDPIPVDAIPDIGETHQLNVLFAITK